MVAININTAAILWLNIYIVHNILPLYEMKNEQLLFIAFTHSQTPYKNIVNILLNLLRGRLSGAVFSSHLWV